MSNEELEEIQNQFKGPERGKVVALIEDDLRQVGKELDQRRKR